MILIIIDLPLKLKMILKTYFKSISLHNRKKCTKKHETLNYQGHNSN